MGAKPQEPAASQLALPLQLDDHAVFRNYHAAGNEPLVAALQRSAAGEPPGCWLWGGRSVGKTHLLQAVCAAAGDIAAYVPLARFATAGPGLIDGLEQRQVVCIDDIDCVAAKTEWEQALFRLYNAIDMNGGVLILSAAMPPRQCPVELPDLASRWSQLPVFQLHALADEDRGEALKQRARHRGMDLPDNIVDYLLRRSRRDMASLMHFLELLDQESLRAKRKLSIAFVREVLNNSRPE